ncbi:MAG: PIN domain-containing protein [Candidatus Sulfotelmatobacter sp.]
MEVGAVRAVLRNHRSIALDTSIFIYQLQSNPRYVNLTHQIFQWLERPGSRAVTSTITMTEILIQPYRDNDQDLIDKFKGLLFIYPNLEWISPDLEIASRAAEIRAHHHLQTPDAVRAATAIDACATAFLTNDPIFRRITSLEVLILDDYV